MKTGRNTSFSLLIGAVPTSKCGARQVARLASGGCTNAHHPLRYKRLHALPPFPIFFSATTLFSLSSSLPCWFFVSASVVKTHHYAATTQANRQQGREKNCAFDDEPVTATKRARMQSHSVSIQCHKAPVSIFKAKPYIKGSIPKTLSKS